MRLIRLGMSFCLASPLSLLCTFNVIFGFFKLVFGPFLSTYQQQYVEYGVVFLEEGALG
jgi:hypothetical protein